MKESYFVTFICKEPKSGNSSLLGSIFNAVLSVDKSNISSPGEVSEALWNTLKGLYPKDNLIILLNWWKY